jgi:ABC-type cobalamin/Fe3+-siderophores transport system ATPase subunit
MTASPLANALLACAAGIYTHEAGVGLLVANRVFLDRDDFTSRFITRDTATRMAVIDWAAAITALDAGEIPCSGGEQRTLRLAASIAGGTPVNLSDTLTGLDDRSIQQLITAIRQASGKAQKTGLILVQRRASSAARGLR